MTQLLESALVLCDLDHLLLAGDGNMPQVVRDVLQLFLIVATSAALLLVAYWLFFRSRNNRLQQAALILVLGGGIGNLIDRVLNGEVVDYINLLFMRFAVFNFADICVCVGVALWVLVIFLEELHEDTKKGPKEQ